MRYDRNMENLDVSSRVCSSLIDGLVPAGGGSPFFSDVLASGVVETGNLNGYVCVLPLPCMLLEVGVG